MNVREERAVRAARTAAAALLAWLAAAGCAGCAGAAPEGAAPVPAPARAAAKPTPPPVDVRDFGAGAGGGDSDAPAINRAIHAAAERGNPFVYLPPGVYTIRQHPGQRVLDIPIRPEVDGLTLYGAPDGSSRIVLDADASAILVNKGDRAPLTPVSGLTLRDLTVEVPGNRGRSDAGVIQLNACPGLHIARVTVHVNGRAQHAAGLKMDGLATSQGTTGLIERVLVDGASKTGIYIASGTHHLTVQGCETRNDWSGPPVNAPPPGIGVSDAHHITIVDHRAHDNRGDGLLISTNGAPPVRMPGLPDAAYGSYFPAQQAHGPATEVRVLGGWFHDNGDKGGSGIAVKSAYPEVPRNILISGAVVRANKGPGVLIEAGASIAVEGAVIADNGAQGILVRDVVLADQHPGISRTSGVRIAYSHIFQNGLGVHVPVGALEIRGRVEGVDLVGGILERGEARAMQRLDVILVEEAGRAPVTRLMDIASAPHGAQAP